MLTTHYLVKLLTQLIQTQVTYSLDFIVISGMEQLFQKVEFVMLKLQILISYQKIHMFSHGHIMKVTMLVIL